MSDASKDLSVPREHGEHRLDEKTASSLIAELSRSTDRVTGRQVNVGRILYQQGDGAVIGLFFCLLAVLILSLCYTWVRIKAEAEDFTAPFDKIVQDELS